MPCHVDCILCNYRVCSLCMGRGSTHIDSNVDTKIEIEIEFVPCCNCFWGCLAKIYYRQLTTNTLELKVPAMSRDAHQFAINRLIDTQFVWSIHHRE